MLLSQLTQPEWLLFAAGTGLLVGLCLLAFRRGVQRYLPIFTTYLAFVLVSSVLMGWVYRRTGFGSWTAWFTAWTAEGVTILLRGLVVVELCRKALRNYRGIWVVARGLLGIAAVFLVIYAAGDASNDANWVNPFVVTAERGLELAMAAVLVLLLGLCAYYRVPLPSWLRLVIIGLCFYSTVQALNDSFLRGWLDQHVFLWNYVRMLAFQLTKVVWLAALWKPLPDEPPAPVLLGQETYDALAPQVNVRLRILNERLLEILRS